VVISDRNDQYGLQVSKFLGERDLVVRPLDTRLGKVPDISAAAIMEDGSPLLILDADDLVRSSQTLLTTGRLRNLHRTTATGGETQARKRVLVVDDSITVREVQRRLLESAGYEVEVAVDGADGWNAIRSSQFDMLISDIDMPRMNGIELVRHVKQDANLKNIPVMIVSYKDREEDRLKGLEAGADYYLTKSSFHDDTLLEAVEDLIGGASA
jgi:two-component system sensor histidine kinase and response regulator WspE